MAGKDKGRDCSVGTQDLTGKVRLLNTSHLVLHTPSKM